MDLWGSLVPVRQDSTRTLGALRNANEPGAHFGLILRAEDMQMLAEKQREALQSTGRVEFGEGPYRDLIAVLCDSPYLSQTAWADTLDQCCELFYRMKSEAAERWSDDELIGRMGALFGGECRGSLTLVADRLWQELHPPIDMDDEADGWEEEPFAQ